MKASVALQRARALVREPHTAFYALCTSQGLEWWRQEGDAVGYGLLYWAAFEGGLDRSSRSHRTVEGQQASYDIAISLALGDEAVGL